MIVLGYELDEVAEFNLKESLRRVTTMFNAMVEYMKRCFQRMTELIKQCMAAMKSAGIVDDEGRRVNPKNSRPAWASPYGPAPKRTRR